MTWPTKDDFVDGDVLTAAQVNNIADNLNLFDPTSATSGQVPVADGAGSVAWGLVQAKIVQVVYAQQTTAFSTSSTAVVDTGLQVTITPTDASNNILVMASSRCQITNASGVTTDLRSGDWYIQDSTATSNKNVFQIGRRLVATSTNDAYGYTPISGFWIGTPPDTAARTYKLRVNVDNANLTLNMTNSAAAPAQLIAWEIKP